MGDLGVISSHDEESVEVCVLCDIARGEQGTPFVDLFDRTRDSADQIVARGDGVFVMVDCAPIALGHLLIVTDEHVRSLAAARPSQAKAVRAQAARIQAELSLYVGAPYVFFEHGPSSDLTESGGCGIDHLHLHALPIASDAVERVLDELGFSTLDDGLAGLGSIVGDQAYLYLGSDRGDHVATGFPNGSQILRRALASAIGDPSVANWRDMILFPELAGTRGRVQAGLEIARALDPSGAQGPPVAAGPREPGER